MASARIDTSLIGRIDAKKLRHIGAWERSATEIPVDTWPGGWVAWDGVSHGMSEMSVGARQ
jgi:phage gp37-like protein